MGFYHERVLPHLIDAVCGSKPIRMQREKVVPHATGRVLEVGMGSGLNLAHYNADQVEFVWGLEPSAGMRKRATANLKRSPVPVRLLDLPGEEIPLDDRCVDTIVLTYTLCTIPGWKDALAQMRRVLKPGGTLLFCEHGSAPDEGVRRWQQRINPLWKRLAGGCNLDRPIPGLLEQAGFAIGSLETMYVPGPRFASYNYWGHARIAG